MLIFLSKKVYVILKKLVIYKFYKMKYLIYSFVIVLILSLFDNYISVNSSYNKFIKSKYSNFSRFDNPANASFRDYIMTVDPKLKRVPLERLYPAYLKTKSQQLKSSNSILWTPVSSNMGGRTKSIMFGANNKIWAGAATGGLWYNNDISNGNSWSTVSDWWPGLSISSICFDPNDSSKIYVGTGEAETAIITYRESSGIGHGIWYTTDSGNSWQPIQSSFDFAYITDIVVKNESGNSVIYAGTMSGEYHDSIFQSNPTDGLYRSDNNGVSWQQVLPNIPGYSVPFSVSDIEVSETGKFFVGTSPNINGVGGGYILISNTGLQGSWTIINQYKTEIESEADFNIPGRVKIASSKSNPNVIYACLSAKSNTTLLAQFPQTIGIYIVKSIDGGSTWTHVNIPNDENGKNWAYLAWHAFSIVVDPNNENNVFIGGLDVHKSVDGGNSWNKISDWSLMYSGGGSNFVHGDIHKIIFNGNSSNEMAVSTDGGVFYTSDASSNSPTFYPRNDNYNTLQFYTCAINSQSGSEYYSGGIQDNGTFYHTNHAFNINDMVAGGDGAYTFFDEDNPNYLISSTYNNQYTVYTNISNYNGYSIGDFESGTFVSPADYDWENNIIYANAGDVENNHLNDILKLDLFNSSYNGTYINTGTTTNLPYSFVRLYKNSQGDPILYIGTPDGKIFKTSNINTSPTSIEITNSQLPSGYISCIQTGKTDDTLLVTLSNYGVQSVWQTYNNGGVWRDISGVNLPDMPIRYAIYHPKNTNQIMLATETGIYTTDNASAAYVVWNAQNNGLANVRTDMLQIRKSDNTVLAATHGRGMFTCTWDPIITNANKNIISDSDILIYPNPTKDIVNIKLLDCKIKNCELFDLNGRKIKQINVSNLKFNISDVHKGTYFVRIYTDKGYSIKKIIKE